MYVTSFTPKYNCLFFNYLRFLFQAKVHQTGATPLIGSSSCKTNLVFLLRSNVNYFGLTMKPLARKFTTWAIRQRVALFFYFLFYCFAQLLHSRNLQLTKTRIAQYPLFLIAGLTYSSVAGKPAMPSPYRRCRLLLLFL